MERTRPAIPLLALAISASVMPMFLSRSHAEAAPPPGAHTAPTSPQVSGSDGIPASTDPFITTLSKNPDDPIVKAYAQAQKTRLLKERELKVIRAKHFRSIRSTEVRQAGIAKLRAYDDPAVFPTLIEVFRHEDNDVRAAILDHLLDQATDEADTTLAWTAIFDKDPWLRDHAGQRLNTRLAITGSASHRIKSVLAHALRNRDDGIVATAAKLTSALGLIEAIPALISAQVLNPGGAGTAADGGEAALAYILVGTQQAFIADLEPVVGESAVAFDPELGIVTEGVILRVIDAVVITYRTEVHYALRDLSTKAWGGRSTAHLGYDQPAWAAWYRNEFLPYRRQLATTP